MSKYDPQSKQGRLGLIFIGLAFGVILLVFAYFYYVLQPRLQQEAQTQASILTQSLTTEFKHRSVLEDAFLLQKEIGKILLYNDDAQNRPFIMGIRIEFNPDFFPHHNRALQRGDTSCNHCFKVVSPLYDSLTLDLLGSMTFYVNPQSHQSLISEISQKFYIILFILSALLALIWFVIRHLWQQSMDSQQKLVESQSYNQQILDTMQDMLFLIDHQGRILDANLSAQNQLRENLQNLQTHFIQEYLQTAEKNKRLLNSIKTLEQRTIEVRFHTSDTQDHYGLLSASRFDKSEQENPRFLLVIKDIQALKTAEAKLAYQAQMAHASRLKSLGEMATGIAHEINQPLAVIRLGAEGIKHSLLAQNPESFEVEIAQDVIDQVDRASQIINNMRSFARLQPSPKRWIAPHHPLNSALSFFKEQLRINCIELVEDIDTDCPEVLIETQKFEQVIVNLITNARHALEEVKDSRIKTVTVELHCDHEQVTIKIEDNGIGMDESTRQHCLDPFFTTKDAGEGTGLGLSIVHNILQEFNINLMIQSEPGKGTAFIMQIPHKLSEMPS
jgi:PAS domain S-box-containing protein